MKVTPFPFRTLNVQQIIQLHPESSHTKNTTERETERKKEKCWFTLLLRSFPSLLPPILTFNKTSYTGSSQSILLLKQPCCFAFIHFIERGN